VSANGYRLLGFVVWQGGKWYLRRRLPSTRRVVVSGLVLCAAVGGAVVLARRAVKRTWEKE
jgi:hypothetical protein